MKEANQCVNERQRDLLIRTPSISFLIEASQQIAIFSSFFAKSEGAEATDKCFELLFPKFFTEVLEPSLPFSWHLSPLIYLVGVPTFLL